MKGTMCPGIWCDAPSAPLQLLSEHGAEGRTSPCYSLLSKCGMKRHVISKESAKRQSLPFLPPKLSFSILFSKPKYPGCFFQLFCSSAFIDNFIPLEQRLGFLIFLLIGTFLQELWKTGTTALFFLSAYSTLAIQNKLFQKRLSK